MCRAARESDCSLNVDQTLRVVHEQMWHVRVCKRMRPSVRDRRSNAIIFESGLEEEHDTPTLSPSSSYSEPVAPPASETRESYRHNGVSVPSTARYVDARNTRCIFCGPHMVGGKGPPTGSPPEIGTSHGV